MVLRAIPEREPRRCGDEMVGRSRLLPLGEQVADGASRRVANRGAEACCVAAGGDDDGGGGGRLGPIQRTGQVRLGDRLVGINGADVTALRFREVMDLLRDMILLPTPSGRGRKEKGGRGTGAGTAAAVSVKEKASPREVDIRKVQAELKRQKVKYL